MFIISGCNGAGKTTASYTILPEILNCREFINADEIAKGISPFQPEKASIEAGRIMLNRIDELMKGDMNFAFETTLSTKSYKEKIKNAKLKGYFVTLLFFWLSNVELAKERVKERVREGGHNIESQIIERRYYRGLINLFDIYLHLVDELMIFDNSEGTPKLVAEKTIIEGLVIFDEDIFDNLKRQYERGKS